jgi:hypothetical protein
VHFKTPGWWGVVGLGKEDVGEKVMQYTGIDDRDGKEIYEGDIVEGHADGPGPIVWQGTGWVYELDDANVVGLDEICIWFGNNARVIGNIHENPELLGRVK